MFIDLISCDHMKIQVNSFTVIQVSSFKQFSARDIPNDASEAD